MAESEVSKDVNPYQGSPSERWIHNQRYQELDAARELAKQTYRDCKTLETECQQLTQRLEELAILESELLRHITKQVKEHPEKAPGVKDKAWVGIDVKNDEPTEDHQVLAEGSSGAESEVISEGESMGKVERERAQLSDQGLDVADIGLNLNRDGDADNGIEKHKDKEELQEKGSTKNMEVIEENGDSVTSLDKLQEELAQIQSLSAREKAELGEKTRSLNVLLHEQQVLLQEIEDEEKAFDTLGLSETLRQTNALEREMQALSTDIDRLERLCEDSGDTDPSSVDEIDGEGSLNNQKRSLIAELTRLQREREKLEREAQEKQAMLELVGELSQLRSVSNSAESNMRDMGETPSDLTAEHYVQGPHKSADSVVAKRLDFETIDFDQFGEQPPELPLSDDVDEELIEPELDQNGEDADVTAKESLRNKAGELQSQFEQTKEQEERTTHMFANLLNIDTKLEQAMKGWRDNAAEETSQEETKDKQQWVALGSQDEKQLVGLLSDSDLETENITPAGESIPSEDNVTQSAEEPDLDHHEIPIASSPDTAEYSIPPLIHDEVLPPEEVEGSSSVHFDQRVEESLLGPSAQTEETSPLQKVQMHEPTKGEDSLNKNAADDLDTVSSSEKDGSSLVQEPELQKSTVVDNGLEEVLETDRSIKSESGNGEGISPPAPERRHYRVVRSDGESSSASFAGKDESEVTGLRGAGDGDAPLQEFENYDIAAEPGPLSITDKHRDLEGIVPESPETNVSSFETAQNISMQEPDTSESNTEEDQLKSLSEKSVSSPLIDEQKKAGDGYSGSPSRRLKRKIDRLQQPHLNEHTTTPKKSKDLDKVTARQAKKLKELSEQMETLAKQLEEQTNLREELERRLEQVYKERQQMEAKLSSFSESLPVSVMPWSEETTEIAKVLEEQKQLLASQVEEAERLRSAAEQKVGMLNDQVHDLEALTDIALSMEDVFSIKDKVLQHSLVTAFQALMLCFGLTIWLSSFTDPMRNSLLPT